MAKIRAIFLLFLAVADVVFCQDPCSFSYPHRCSNLPILDDGTSECLYQSSWDHNARTDLVTFDISIKNPDGDRWLAIAFSHDRLMPRSDVIIGWINRQPTGDTAILSDRYIFGYLEPIVDKEQDAQLITWSSMDGRSAIRFTRPRITFDQRDVNLTSSSPCPYFFFTHDPGRFDARGTFTQHNDPPIIYGPVCMSSCSATNYVLRRGDCRRHSHLPIVTADGEKLTRHAEAMETEHLFSANQISFADCKQKCDTTAECTSFTYLADGSACYLLRSSCLAKEFNPTIANTYHYEKMDMAGFSNARSDACLTHHFENALDLRLLTLSDCAKTCESMPECPGFSYQPLETRCFLHRTTCSPNAFQYSDPIPGAEQQVLSEPETFAFIKLSTPCEVSDVLVMMAFTQDTISPHGLNGVVDFLVHLMSRFDIDSDVVKFGYTLWSEEAPARVADFQGEFDREQLIASINLINYSELPQNDIVLPSMFQFAYTHAFVSSTIRPSAKRTLIFLTTGHFERENIEAAAYEASQAARRGIRVIAVGLGDLVDEEHLKTIVNNSDDSVFMDRDFENLNALTCKLSNLHCSYPDCAPGQQFMEPRRDKENSDDTADDLEKAGSSGVENDQIPAQQEISTDFLIPVEADSTQQPFRADSVENYAVAKMLLAPESGGAIAGFGHLFPNMDCPMGVSSEGFVFYAMFLSNIQPDVASDLELFVSLSATNRPNVVAAVEIDSHYFRDRLFVHGGQMGRVLLPRSAFEMPLTGSAALHTKGLKISANATITVFTINRQGQSSDGAIIFSEEGLGSEYLTVAYYPSDHFTQFGILSPHNNNLVSITLPPRDEGLLDQSDKMNKRPRHVNCSLRYGDEFFSNGDTLTIRMNYLDTFQLQSACDLSGTAIRSRKPIAVFSGNVLTSVTNVVFGGYGAPSEKDAGRYQSHLVDQLPPVSRLGRLHAAVSAPRRLTGDAWAIVAPFDNTELSIYSNDRSTIEVSTRFLHFGQKYEFTSVNDMHFLIASTKPVLVAQFVKSEHLATGHGRGTSPSMVIYPPMEQWAKRYTFLVPYGYKQAYKNYLVVTVKKGQEDGILLNGESAQLPTDASWLPINGSPDLVSAFIPISEGVHTIYHEQWFDMRLGALVYSTGPNGSLYYSAGQCLANLNCESTMPQPNDLVDNDCDGFIDEELFNDRDDDNDGRIDEDIYEVFVRGTEGYVLTDPATTVPTTTSSTTSSSTTAEAITQPEATSSATSTSTSTSSPATSTQTTTWTTKTTTTSTVTEPKRLSKVEMEKFVTAQRPVELMPTTLPLNTTTTQPATTVTAAQAKSTTEIWLINFMGPERFVTLRNISTTSPIMTTAEQTSPIYLTLSRWKHVKTTTQKPPATTRRRLSQYTRRPSVQYPRRPPVKPVRKPSTTPKPNPVDSFLAPTKSDLRLHYVCFGDTLSITCPKQNSIITIVSAHFGRINFAREVTCASENPTTCGGHIEDNCGYADAFFVVDEACSSLPSCSIPIDGALLRRIPNNSTCDVCQMYMTYAYFCHEMKETCAVLANTNRNIVTYAQGNYVYRKGYEVDFSFEAIEAAMNVLTTPNCTAARAASLLNSNETATTTTVPQTCTRDDDFHRNQYYPPAYSKLCNTSEAPMQASDMLAWCPPYTCSSGCLPYLQIDLHGYYKISGIVLQGRRKWDAWISDFRIEHSFDSKAYNALARIFTGPSNARDIVHWKFNSLSFVARYIRIVVTRYHGYPAGHIDIIRCKQYEPVGCRPISIPHTSMKREPSLRNRVVEVSCDPGWMTANNLTKYTVRCASNYLWQGIQPCDKPRLCSDIPVVAGALHNATSLQIGATVQYTCTKGGTFLRGNSTIHCKEDARWTAEPVCEEF